LDNVCRQPLPHPKADIPCQKKSKGGDISSSNMFFYEFQKIKYCEESNFWKE
jgi:hypothetical protein